jgi:hypothetical protein
MNFSEAERFLSSYNNDIAREFVRSFLLHNYTDAILEHHPDNVEYADIYDKCRILLDAVFSDIGAISHRPGEIHALFKRYSRLNRDRASIWFEEFLVAYENYKHHRKLFVKVSNFEPYLTGNSFCDIGCGGGDLVYFMKQNYPRFREYAGIDVIDWRTEKVKDLINFQMLDFSRAGTKSNRKYDTLTCIAVLHHVGNTVESLNVFLQNAKTAISGHGRLIVEEDVLLPDAEIRSNPDYRLQVEDLKRDQHMFSEFTQMDRSDQTDVFILIDLFANAFTGGVSDMAYPYGFRSINEWNDLFTDNGFKIEDVDIKGFQKGLFNRSSHVYFILSPS